MLGRKINQSHVKSGLKENKLTHSVTRTVTFNQNSKKFSQTKAHHTRLVKQQRNQVQVSNHGSSVTVVCKSSDTDDQVKLKNRFQVLQNAVDHESLDNQGFHNFRVTVENKHAKVSKKPNVAPRVSDSKFLVRNEEIAKHSVLNSSQKSAYTDLDSHDVIIQHQEGGVIDLDNHVTDSHLVITGNCEPDNRNNLQSKPQNVKNIVGECKNSGMCVEKQSCISQTGGYFGFVPETSLKLYQGPPVYCKDIPNILQAHALVQNSGTHNYLKCRIPVKSHLNIDRWAYNLRDSYHILLLLSQGFPLDFVRTSPLTISILLHWRILNMLGSMWRKSFSMKPQLALLIQYLYFAYISPDDQGKTGL